MRDVVRVTAIGAGLGVAYGVLFGVAIAVGAILSSLSTDQTPPLEVVGGGAAMAVYLAGVGSAFGLAIGAAYGLVTGLVVAVGSHLRSRWSPLLAALVVLAAGQLGLPGRLTGDAPFLFDADPALDDLVQSIVMRAVPSAIAAFVAWRVTGRARQSSGAVAIG